jgi:hypothetical protein
MKKYTYKNKSNFTILKVMSIASLFTIQLNACCCSSEIAIQVGAFTKSVSIHIEDEIKNIDEATKSLNAINNDIEKRGYKWNKKIYGKIITNSLTENFLYAEPNFLLKKIDKEQNLLLQSNLNSAKNILLINKLEFYNNKKGN